MRTLRNLTLVLLVVLVPCGLAATVGRSAAERSVRTWLVKAVEDRFAGKVQLANLQISLWPLIKVTGEGVVVRQKDAPDQTPLLVLKRFSLQASVWQLLRPTKHVEKLRLEGLHIQIPPHKPESSQNSVKPSKLVVPFVVDEVITENAQLDLLPKNGAKPVRAFIIHQLKMRSVGLGRPAWFHAQLTNPVPTGQIDVTGHFGPWNAQDASATALSGDFKFAPVDMKSIKGLAGTLTASGKFDGRLDRIETEGKTDTPDFSLNISNHPVDLKTQYHAVVDGTNGNTLLTSVHAEFLNSEILVDGGVFRSDDPPGRRITLNIKASHAQLQDLLRLGVKADEPPMTGLIDFQTKFDLPAGKPPTAGRLNLDGQFQVAKGQLTKVNLQEKIKSLSRRGMGKPDEKAQGSDVFNLSGKFKLQHGTISLSQLTFDVPGAALNFTGTYALLTSRVNFHGSLSLDAKLSHTTTGVKSVLLKPLQPLFSKKDGGTLVPVKVTGTSTHPSVGLDLGRKGKERNKT